MNFKQLLDKFEDEPILRRIVYRYRDQKQNRPGYEDALRELRSKRTRKTGFIITLSRYEEDGEKWVNVSGLGKNPGDKEKILYALGLTPWSQWLGMEIAEKTLKEFKEIDILAHCLWEMTWHGYSDREIKNMTRKMIGRVKSIVEREKK